MGGVRCDAFVKEHHSQFIKHYRQEITAGVFHHKVKERVSVALASAQGEEEGLGEKEPMHGAHMGRGRQLPLGWVHEPAPPMHRSVVVVPAVGQDAAGEFLAAGLPTEPLQACLLVRMSRGCRSPLPWRWLEVQFFTSHDTRR